MGKVKLSVLGCCVSREMFNYTDDFEIVGVVYSSYISLFEDKIDISLAECISCISSQFQARNAYLEFNKTVFEYLKQNKGDYIILDFAEVVDEFYIVENELDGKEIKIVATPNIKEILNFKGYKFKRISSSDCEISAIVKELFENLLNIYPKERILLNKASYAKFYIRNNALYKFTDHYRLTKKNMDKVRAFEAEAEKYLNKSNIFLPIDNVISNGEHKYGCSPVHYFDDDYYFMAHRFCEKFGLIHDRALYMSYAELYKNGRNLLLSHMNKLQN